MFPKMGGRGMRNSLKVLALIAAPFSGIVGAEAAPIFMPTGSTVWMKWEAGACPDADGDDCVGSNTAGPNPANGIPSTTITDALGRVATGSAEILPDRVRTFINSNSAAFMFASFEDTYTVHGSAPGPFDITVNLNVTGSMSTVPAGPFHQLVAGHVEAIIGTFDPTTEISGLPFPEGSRVRAFPGSPNAEATTGVIDCFCTVPTTMSPFSITAFHTVTGLSVGDTLVLAFEVKSAFSRGEIDILNTGTIGFDLPPGVFLTSALGGRFGAEVTSEVPLPGALPLFAGGLGLLTLLARRRKQQAQVA
jgi:hypothetical protein